MNNCDFNSIENNNEQIPNIINDSSRKYIEDVTFDKSGLNFIHLNVHYLYPKMHELNFMIDKIPNTDIVGLCETFLSDSFSNQEIELNNFQLFRRDRG